MWAIFVNYIIMSHKLYSLISLIKELDCTPVHDIIRLYWRHGLCSRPILVDPGLSPDHNMNLQEPDDE